ncbi:methylated-DNA--[protein]-cysteine S-methyltransferase [Chlorobaculum sp. 24CR]|uniref:methylated-DNA--[protein]-cysteine S-methyltransferase n=1 Tax=Chlorobaculum sp. 24CR TaxID=2508878 RepID=UPI00100B67B3|nr:methylated-DNA--[protein]-cysteine S-methyltransferase [Chlorobaculum sp. 24CR]RXK84891.1 methylated-DNA--[protein]-cysteine S-methyltransferase [Chlorobaculum sp. 24CR]
MFESILSNYSSFSCRWTPVGLIGVRAHGGALTQLLFMHDEPATAVSAPGSPLIDEAFRQLDAWFTGRLREFSLPIADAESVFARRVREVMAGIPYGRTVSYGELAASIGSPGAARAAGAACARNPLPIIVPCHRVVAAGGRIGGYRGGTEMKRWLLDFERGNCR